jgi:hypothetical protein
MKLAAIALAAFLPAQQSPSPLVDQRQDGSVVITVPAEAAGS